MLDTFGLAMKVRVYSVNIHAKKIYYRAYFLLT